MLRSEVEALQMLTPMNSDSHSLRACVVEIVRPVYGKD